MVQILGLGDVSLRNSRNGIAGGGAVTRTQAGLLFSDSFTRADGAVGADWVVESGTWSIASNKLRGVAVNNATAVIRLATAAMAYRKEMHVQYRATKTTSNKNFLQAFLRRNLAGTQGYMQTVAPPDAGTGPDEEQLYLFNASVYTLVGRLAGGAYQVNAEARFAVSVVGSGAPVTIASWIGGILPLSMSDSTVALDAAGTLGFLLFGQPGGDPSTNIDINDVAICTSRLVTVSGMRLGWKVRIGTIVSAAADGTGIVVVDLAGSDLPQASLEILDATSALVYTHTQSGGTYGGDAYVSSI